MSVVGGLPDAGQDFECSPLKCIEACNGSAVRLVNLIVEHFDVFRDETIFQGKRVRFYKRAQILAADLWACFEGESFGHFEDIGRITMFAGMFCSSLPSYANSVQTIESRKCCKVWGASGTVPHWSLG